MERAFEVQRAARENVQDLKSYLTDLGSWESEMKRKEAALRGEPEKELPPVRSRLKKERPVVPGEKVKPARIPSSDYSSWEKFDADVECEQVDMSEVGPTSLDARRSSADKSAKLREEAQYEKERGNSFVKQEQWDLAVECYNRAIELVPDDAIYFANRGLCHLKKERLHQAESDCTAAIGLDPTYVKAYQRRASAREQLCSLRAASHDLEAVLRLEPNNTAARRQLLLLKQRMPTKGGKFKSSPATTPASTPAATPAPSPTEPTSRATIVELPDELPALREVSTKVYDAAAGAARGAEEAEEAWRDGSIDGADVVQPLQKPPHLRSKTPLKLIPIDEIELGQTEPRTVVSGEKVVRVSADEGKGDSLSRTSTAPTDGRHTRVTEQQHGQSGDADRTARRHEGGAGAGGGPPPTTCVQFMSAWRERRGDDVERLRYLGTIDPGNIPLIFGESLESEVLSEMLRALASPAATPAAPAAAAYLRSLAAVKRFPTLVMFLSHEDKQVVRSLLRQARDEGSIPEEDLKELQIKFEV